LPFAGSTNEHPALQRRAISAYLRLEQSNRTRSGWHADAAGAADGGCRHREPSSSGECSRAGLVFLRFLPLQILTASALVLSDSFLHLAEHLASCQSVSHAAWLDSSCLSLHHPTADHLRCRLRMRGGRKRCRGIDLHGRNGDADGMCWVPFPPLPTISFFGRFGSSALTLPSVPYYLGAMAEWCLA
jgi:hypothetical protein